jgi:twitching motility two-component system response regulator PilG
MHPSVPSAVTVNAPSAGLADYPPASHNVMDSSRSPQANNLYRVLQKLIANKGSGKLIIHNQADPSIHWRIYLGNGRIHYAGSEQGQSERLNYLLQRYLPEKNLHVNQAIGNDYQYLCELWESQGFAFQEIRSILARLTQEALIQILSLPHPLCYFEETVGLERLLLYLDLKQLMQPVGQEIKYWLKLRSVIASPFQRPTLEDAIKIIPTLRQLEKLNSDNLLQQFENLPSLLKQELCVYEVAQRLDTSVLNVGAVLKNLVRNGAVKMSPYERIQADSRPIIACVDDSPSIQRVVKFALEATGFRVVSISEASSALTALLHAKPALILMDINMPDIDGYQLCSICNKSEALKHIPIVMLTGRSGVLDRVKAKMYGSVGYICKPFQPQELVNTVRNFVTVNS